MGKTSRRVPEAIRRLYAGAVVFCLLAPSPAAAAALRRASTVPSAPAAAPGGLDGLRDAVASAGWAPSASLNFAPLAAPAGAAASVPYGGAAELPAFLAFRRVLESPEPTAGSLREAAAALAEAAPATSDWLGLRVFGPLEGVPDRTRVAPTPRDDARARLDDLQAAAGLGAAPLTRVTSLAADAPVSAAAARLAGFSAPPLVGRASPGVAWADLAAAPAPPRAPLAAAPARSLSREERLSQGADLAAPRPDRAATVEELLAEAERRLDAPPPAGGTGATGSDDARWAGLDSLRRLLDRAEDPAAPARPATPDLAGTPLERRVAEAAARVEAAQSRVQAGLAEREAAEALLAVAERARQSALRERRGGRDTLEFRRNYARLAMVMDLSYSLNVLNSADTALGRLINLVDQRFAAIEERRRSGASAGGESDRQAGRVEEWRREASEGAAADRVQAADFASLSTRAGALAASVERFRVAVPSLLSAMDARDRARSPDALTEYARRLALLPELAERLRSGGGGSGVSDLSRPWLEARSREITGYRVKLADADRQLAQVPLEFAGVLVAVVPGVPENSLRNPDAPAVLAMLEARKAHWRAQGEEHRGYRDDAAESLDPSATRRVFDDFGDSIPASHAAWRAEERAKAARLDAAAQPLAEETDGYSARFEALVPGAALPRLAGRSADEHRTALVDLLDRLDAARLPEGDAQFEASALRIDIARNVSFLGDLTAERLKARGTASALDRPVDVILPEARARFTESAAAMDTVVADAVLDEAYARAGFPSAQAQALIDRKRALVNVALSPMLERLQGFIDRTLLPFVDERVAQSGPDYDGDGYAKLYREKKNLYERVAEGLRVTLPWALATNGAAEGDRAAAAAGIETVRATYRDYKGTVVDFLDQMRRRKDPANAETEPLYGETVPYSLVRRAAVYREERAARAARLNALAGELASILGRIDELTGSRRRLAARYVFPTVGESSADELTALADRRFLQDLAADLKAVGDEAAAAGGGDIAVGGGDGGIPTGTQPPVDVSASQRTALLVVEAVKRLVPSTATGVTGGPGAGTSYAESLARYLFADALVSSSETFLAERIPLFEAFLRRADSALDAALADADLDAAWIGGDLAGGEALLARKASLLGRLRDVAREGAELFGQKAAWSEEGVGTVDRVQTYYDTLSEVYRSGGEALDAEERAARETRGALLRARQDIQDQRRTVTGWLAQLNDPRENAMARVAQNMTAIQERTRAVLEANIDARRVTRQRDAAVAVVEGALRELAVEREALSALLEEVGDAGRLSPDLAVRAVAAGRRSPAWLAAGPRGPQTLVIPKGSLASFLSQLFAAFAPDTASRDLVELRETILRDPASLARLLPGAGFAEFGEGTNGFYLVYQTEFSTPGGLETSQQVTLGNVLRLWGQNVSVIGHRFASPPSQANAPFGDQGVTVRVESLDSDRMVNYLDVTFHKLVQDIPTELGVGGQAQEARMMVFDDFALMVADGKVYFGAAGFADVAMTNPGDNPQYYGANLRARVRFTEVLTLNAEQTLLLARDPRRFLQTINLDFTGFDPALDETFSVEAEGEDRRYARTRLGVGVDLGRVLGTRDTFTMDIHYSRVSGTDAVSQDAIGATVLRGFSFDVAGTPATLNLEAGYELGQRYDTVVGRASFALPDMGLVLSAQGKVLGTASAFYAEARQRLGDNSSAALSYGSRYIGLNDRLAVSLESSFSLGELWRAASGDAARDLTGGRALAVFERELETFFTRDDPTNPALAELRRVFDSDIGRRLTTLEIGRLSREVGELVRAGAFLDNVRTGAMVGFVSGPVGEGTAERATGGGFQAGTRTDVTLTRSQRALVESRATALLELGLDLQERLLELTRAWQATLAAVASARWRRQIALYTAAHSQDPVLAAEARADAAVAAGLESQALLRYNALTGRGPSEAPPFGGLNPQDLDRLLSLVSGALSRPTRLADLLSRARTGLDIPSESLHVLDWIPWIERLTFSVGSQLPDMLSSQALGASFTVRLPIYDPTRGHAQAALELTDRAVLAEMAGRLARTRLRARGEALAAASWDRQSRELAARAPAAANAVGDALRAFRNALILPSALRAAVREWSEVVGDLLDARVQGSLQAAWAILDARSTAATGEGRDPGVPPTWGEAFDAAVTRSPDWEALALRSAAARELLEAADRRVRKVDVDLSVGANLTATGVALIPAFGLTGLGAWPTVTVELAPAELRDLEVSRRGAEQQLYTRWQDKVAADAAAGLAAAAGEAAFDARALELCRAAGAEAPASLCAGLDMRRRESEAAANHLLGRPLEARWRQADPDAALAALAERLAARDPVAAARDVLASRVAVARAVEQAVDSGLRAERLRLEPVSLVGRSLGRLLNALSGEGGVSPELMAAARERVIEAERALEAFEENLPALRARMTAELATARSRRASLEGRTEVVSRLAALELDRAIFRLRAALLSLGGEGAAPPRAGAPTTWAQLQERLRAATLAAEPGPSESSDSGVFGSSPLLEAGGTARWYRSISTLAGDPVGRTFIESWVEVRLRSPATRPEALAALALLRERAFDDRRALAATRARARADALLSRLRLGAALSRRAGPAADRARARLDADLAEVAGLLGLGPDEAARLLALLPAEAEESDEAAARRALADAETLDLDLIGRVLFEEGLPGEVGAARDRLPQLRADLIAERMSYKGFTPVAAFGLFRGSWVQAGFLEAPDPERLRGALTAVLDDALRRELEAQDRLKGLGLMLHALLASVADGTHVLSAQRERVVAARRHLLGMGERRRAGMAPETETDAALAEALAAQAAFLEALFALKRDFARLVVELTALGVEPGAYARAPGAAPSGDALDASERSPRERLLSYWADRLLDEDFERRNAEVLADAPASVRDELARRAAAYRTARRDASAVSLGGFTPSETLDLLMRCDVQGRRQGLEEVLGRLMDGLGGPRGGWTAVAAFLRADVAGRAENEADGRARQETLSAALRAAYVARLDAPPAVAASIARLSALSERVGAARRDALASWLARTGGSEDHLLRDRALDAYVSALDAFDAEVEAAMGLPETRADAGWTRAFDALFDVRESLRRRRDRLTYGRGMLTADAAVGLAEARLRALAFDPAESRDLDVASESLSYLRSLRERWRLTPSGVAPLYAVAGPDGDTWLSEADVARYVQAGRVVEADGRRFLLPTTWVGAAPRTVEQARAAGAAEIIGGVDAAAAAAAAARRRRDASARARALAATLETAEVALTDGGPEEDGAPVATLSLADLRRLEASGRALWFEAGRSSRTGLRGALPALSARWRDPASLVLYVLPEGAAADPARWPSLEAFLADSASAAWRRGRVGRAGLAALSDEARRESLESRRAGWLRLKLEAFAFALGPDGEPVAVFMDASELEAARARAAVAGDPSAAWTFHRADDLVLGLADDGAVVEAWIAGRRVDLGGVGSRRLAAAPAAAEVDASGRVRRVFETEADVRRASAGWWLEDAEGRVWRDLDGPLPPYRRLRRWIDPETGEGVRLGRPLLERRLDAAEDGVSDAQGWSYRPTNWPQIVLEVPRGVLRTPVELITGRSPEHEGYLGRAWMYRGEGGATERRDALGRLLHAIDLLDLLPDPVTRWQDPSQFPDRVDVEGAPRPGEGAFDRDARTVDGRHNVHFGAGAWLREVRWAREDRDASRDGILASFRGGVRRESLEVVRGRGGLYADSSVTAVSGRQAVLDALAELGSQAGADGRGTFAADPRRGAVERVTVAVEVTLGAAAQDARLRAYEEALRRLAAAPALEGDDDAAVAAAEAALAAALAARAAAARALDAAAPSPRLPGHAPALLALTALRR